MDPPMSARMLASDVHQAELLLHLARLPAPRSRATTPEAVEATLAYVHEVLVACGWQVTRGLATRSAGRIAPG